MNHEEIKSCCADAYSKDIVALLLGDSTTLAAPP